MSDEQKQKEITEEDVKRLLEEGRQIRLALHEEWRKINRPPRTPIILR